MIGFRELSSAAKKLGKKKKNQSFFDEKWKVIQRTNTRYALLSLLNAK